MKSTSSKVFLAMVGRHLDLLGLLLVLLVGGFFLLYRLPQIPDGLDGEFVEVGTAGFSLVLSRNMGVPPEKVMGMGTGLAKSWREITLIRPFIFEQYTYGHPLSSFLLYLVFSVFGSSVLSMTSLNAIMTLSVVVLTYMAGRAMYGRLEGMLAAILLASSLFFLITIRTGAPYFATTSLTALLTLSAFVTAHQRRSRKLLWLSGAALGLSALMAWVGIIVVALVLASLFAVYATIYLMKVALSLLGRYAEARPRLGLESRTALDKDPKDVPPSPIQRGWPNALRVSTPLFGIVDYLGFAAIAVGIALLATMAYSVYFYSPPLRSLGMIGAMLFQYGGSRPALGDNMAAFFGSLLSSMLPYTKGGDVPTSTMPGQPMMYPAIAALIAMGLVACLWRRSLADNLLLIWAGVTFAIFVIFFAFRIRYMVVAAPVLYLLAATGLVTSGRLLWKGLSRLNPSPGYQRGGMVAVWVLSALVILPSLVSTYQQFFVNFPLQGINRTRWHGQAQVPEYFLNNVDPASAQLVFWEKTFQPYVFFFFSAQGKPYPVVYWNDLAGYVTGDRDKWKDDYSQVPPWDANLRNKIRQWEESLIAQGKTIYYVAPVNITYEHDWEFNGGPEEQARQNQRLRDFQDLHPNLPPLLTVDYVERGPHFAIYAVDKETPTYYTLNATNGFQSVVNTKEANRIKFLKIRGTVKEPAISVGASTLKLPITLSGGDDLAITFDRNSSLTQTRLAQNYANEAADHQNLVYKEGVAPFLRWLELENPTGDFQTQHEGYLVYKIESPGAITKLTAASYPRVYNDTDQRNSLAMLYSLDGVNYRPVYEITSDGNGKDIKSEERKDEIEVSGRAIYIKFVFKGHGNPLATAYPTTVQLWSIPDKPMTFVAQMDTSSLAPLVLTPGANMLKFTEEGTGGTAAVTLAFDGPVSMDSAR